MRSCHTPLSITSTTTSPNAAWLVPSHRLAINYKLSSILFSVLPFNLFTLLLGSDREIAAVCVGKLPTPASALGEGLWLSFIGSACSDSTGKDSAADVDITVSSVTSTVIKKTVERKQCLHQRATQVLLSKKNVARQIYDRNFEKIN